MGISQYPVYWVFKKPLEKDLQGFLKLCDDFWIIGLDLQQKEKEFQYKYIHDYGSIITPISDNV